MKHRRDERPPRPGRPEKHRGGQRPAHGSGRAPHADESTGLLWIYGRHAVAAALANPARRIERGVATKNAMDWMRGAKIGEERLAMFEDFRPDAIDHLLHAGAVHQGVAIAAHDLERARLKDICTPDGALRPVVVLDQITDPQNIGAIFRASAAFGAAAVIVQERRTPPLSGALAKAAAGAVETLPCVKVVNISRALEALKDLGYFCAGLAGESDRPISDLPRSKPLAIVLGAEGAGLRQLVGETCDALFRIPIDASMESLNVSTAAAVTLYEARRAASDQGKNE